MHNWFKIALFSLIGLCLGIALSSLYFRQKLDSRVLKINSDEVVRDEYQKLLRMTMVGTEYSDQLDYDLKKSFTVESDSNHVILNLKESLNTVDFYGFYMLLDSNKVVMDIGLHKP